jgi:hypothetical protein
MIVVADAGAGIVGRHHQRLGPSAAGSTDLSQCRRAVFGDLIERSHIARGEHAHHNGRPIVFHEYRRYRRRRPEALIPWAVLTSALAGFWLLT